MTQLRGLFTFRNQLHVVRGSRLIRVDSNHNVFPLAILNSTAGPLDFDENLTQLQITDGSFLYVWDGVTLQTALGFVAGPRITVLGQRTVNIERNSQRFHWSEPGNALAQAALNFASAESVPDELVACVRSNGDLWLGGKFSTEVHALTTDSRVFAQYRGSTIPYGVAAAHTMRECDRSPIWLAQTKEGGPCVVRGDGQQAKPISNRSIDEQLAGRNLQNATAFVYEEGKSKFYCLNVPNLHPTFVYDATYGQWHKEADVHRGRFIQLRSRCHAFAYNRHYFGTIDGDLLYADRDVHTFVGDPKVRSRVCPVIGKQTGRFMRFGRFEVVCERATGGTVMLRYKDDPQAGFGAWRRATSGDTGHYTSRIVFDRLGTAKGLNGRVYELRFADDAPFNPVSVEPAVV